MTGILYSGLITVIAKTFFPWEANGSLITIDNEIVGSFLIGQAFNDPKFFWGRPSETPGFPYNPMNSGGSNLASSNPKFLEKVKERHEILIRYHNTIERDLYKAERDPQLDLLQNKDSHFKIPIELLTASGSGLDPDISEAAVLYQIPRIAKARGLTEEEIMYKIQELFTKDMYKSNYFEEEAKCNVLKLNIALEGLTVVQKK